MAGFVNRYMDLHTVHIGGTARSNHGGLPSEQEPFLPPSTVERPLLLASTQFLMVLVFIEAIALYGLIVGMMIVGGMIIKKE
jgi:hypothetical protein